MPIKRAALCSGHPYPAAVIPHAVQLYFGFPLNQRMAEEMLAGRGIVISHETIRSLWLELGGAAPSMPKEAENDAMF